MLTTRSLEVAEIMKQRARKEVEREAENSQKEWDAIILMKSGCVSREEMMTRNINDFREILPDGAWNGRRCFIIGGGPSLKGFNFKRLEQELTIGINRAFEYLDPSIIFWMDNQGFYQDVKSGEFGEDSRQLFESQIGFKIALNIVGHEYPLNVYSIKAAPSQHPFSHSIKDGLVDGDNSGFAALNLAVCLGANPIYLLGMDMKGDGKGNQTWFHGGYKSNRGEAAYKKFKTSFNAAAPALKKEGIQVINLNMKSEMKCFPFQDINKISPPVRKSKTRKYDSKKKRKWILTSFYTRGTSYEKEIKKLVESLRKLDLPHHIYGFEPIGTWRANLNYKSHCILDAFKRYPDKDIVFVDADAVVRQDPALFDELSADHAHNMAATFHTYGPESGGPDELLSGTLWFKNCGFTRGLVKLWHEMAMENPLVIHQRCLKYAIEQMEQNGNPVHCFRMPWEYTCVFDYERSKGVDPVIEHFQASRRLREEVGFGAPLIKGVQL